MSNTILLKRSGNVAAVPLAGNLTLGELSLNYADGVLYFLNSSNAVTVLANANTASGTQLVNGTSNVHVAASSNVTISSAGTANVLTISSTGTIVSGTESVTGNITGGNILTGGLISATGNVTGNYILGNGSQLTGIVASAGAAITNGNSNVTVAANANVTVGITGVSNVVVFATTGEYVTGVVSATGNITGGNITTTGTIYGNTTISLTGNSVAIGYSSGNTTANNYGVAIGTQAGESQGLNAVAIGQLAGYQGQGSNTVAIGYQAGAYNNQGLAAVAIGYNAGYTLQSNSAVAVGSGAGFNTQGLNAVAVGIGAGTTTQGNNSVAVGQNAGQGTQGSNAIAIGAFAGYTSQGNNSIILNATGSQLNQTVANTFTVAPVRNDVANISQVVFYNTTSKEVTYGNTISVTGNISSGNLLTGGLISVAGNITAGGNTIFNNKTYYNFSGDEQQISLDPSILRLGSWSLTTSGALYTLVGEPVMWYWIHNGSIDSATGNFNARDDGGPVTLWALSESMLIRTWISPPSQTLSVPSTWILTSTQDTNNGLFTTGGVSGNALKLTQVATPIAAVGTASTTGGTLSAGNYYVKVVGIDVNGNPTAPSVESTVITTTGTTSSIAYIIPATPGVNSYQIYVTQSSGVYTSGYFTYNPDYLTNYFTLTTLSGTTAGTIPSTNSTGGIVAAGNVSTTGNITGGNVNTGGLVSATGNVYGNYFVAAGTGGTISGSGNITGGNLLTGGAVSATGNVIGGNISGTGNITGGNLLTGGAVSATGNISTAGTANIATGNISAAGTVVAATVNAATIGNTGASHVGASISVTGTATAASTVGGVMTGTSLSTTANVTGGNVVTATIAPVGNLVINAANVVLAATFSNTGAYLTVPAGNATVAPLQITSGTLLTTDTAGAFEYSGNTLYFGSTAGNRGAVSTGHYYRLGANLLLAAASGNQIWTGVSVGLAGNTTYAFTGQFNLVTTGTTSHTEAIGFGGTAGITNIGYFTNRANANAITTAAANIYSVYRTSNLQSVQTGAFTTAQNVCYQLSGTVATGAPGTFSPQFAFSANPGGTSTVVTGSYFQIFPLGAGPANLAIGNWA